MHARAAPVAAVLGAALLMAGAVPVSAQSDASDLLLCDAPESRQFDFWVGDWDVVNRQRRPPAEGLPAGGPWGVTGTAADRVHAVVGGCGVVEHWRGDAHAPDIAGFSIRAWNEGADRWDLVLLWPAPGQASFTTLEGGFRHGRGEFFRENVLPGGDTTLVRFTFSDVSETSLRWENGVSTDGGWSWAPNWIMEFTRRGSGAAPLDLGTHADATDRCPGEEHRAFDRWLGEWAGSRVGPRGDTMRVRARLTRMLDGCAVVEVVEPLLKPLLPDRWEAYRVRAFDAGAGGWVEWELAADRRRLVRRAADPAGEPWVLVESRDGPGARRTRWEAPSADELRWVVETRSAGGVWEPHAVVELHRLGS